MPTRNHDVSRRLIAFATGWDSRFGGINVFNTRFLQQLGFASKGKVSVVCVVPSLPPGDAEQEPVRDVQLVKLPYPTGDSRMSAEHAPAAIEALKSEGVSLDADGLVWLGHDRITGEIALQARNLAGGRAALIHHMSYDHYEAYAESSASAHVKSSLQRTLFNEADVRMAIGPLLRSTLQDMVLDGQVTTLIPGLDEVQCVPAPERFTAFMSGRLSADTAKIKQTHLGVAAVAEVRKRASSDQALFDALGGSPQLILRGADMGLQPAASATLNVDYWMRFACERAGRVVAVHALSYTMRREDLLAELARSTVALMPSWHEGFGLAGWEAIAAGVPLILSQDSGLYRFLREESNDGWLNWVYPVDVHGQIAEPFFQARDLEQVSSHLVEIARGPKAARDKAARLREAVSRYTWKKCVDSALAALEWTGVDSPVVCGNTAPRRVTDDLRVPARSGGSPLELPQARWHEGGTLAESQLLRAEEAAVAFDSAREPELSKLIGWARDASCAQALRLITASGGTGKTRLAIELCVRLGNQGWHCGFFRMGIGRNEAAAAWSQLTTRTENVLVVFDYAETRQDTLLGFIKAMLHDGPERSGRLVRILLLARAGGEWWERLPSHDAVTDAFLSGHATSGPITLPPLHVEIDKREAAFQAAVAAYSARIGVSAEPDVQADLTGEHFGRPLYIQMAALLALRGERPATAEGLTKALLHHERRYWARLVQEPTVAGEFAESPGARYATELMTLATLAGGLKRPAEARRYWEAWEGSSGRELSASQQRTLFEQLAPFYPGQQGLQPLRPDLLGEALVAHALLQQSGDGLLDAVLGSGHTAQRRNALTVIARLSNHRPDVESAIVQGLTRHFVPCAADMVSVATQSDSLLPHFAEQAFARLPLPIRTQAAGVLSPLLAHETVQLAQLACAVSYAKLKQAEGKLSGKPKDIALRAGYAEILASHALNLIRAGRDPLQYSKQSIDVLEQLVARNSDEYEVLWARSLSNHASFLADEGHDTEALVYGRKALEIHRRLSKRHPDKYEHDWATALAGYANQLSKNGRDADAVIHGRTATESFGRLAAKDPARFESEWARSLSNFATHLMTEGQHDEALVHAWRALEIQRRLAAASPDRFEPVWAASLSNYATHLSNQGRFAEGLAHAGRAVEITERLAAKNPDRYEPDWAMSLSNLAYQLADNGRDAEALVYDARALEIFERLASKNPDRFTPGLASILSNGATHLSANEQDTEALPRARRALEIRQRLAADRPESFEPDLVSSLSNYASSLSDVGQDAEALFQAWKAYKIHKRLVAKNPERFEPSWAVVLGNYATHLAERGQNAEALVRCREALNVFERLAIKQPVRFMGDAYAMLLEEQWFVWLNDTGTPNLPAGPRQRPRRSRGALATNGPLDRENRASQRFSVDYIIEKHVRGALLTRSDAPLEVPPPDLAWCRPLRLPELEINHQWVIACWAREASERAAALTKMVEMGWELGSRQFRQIEWRWLCAAAWLAAHPGNGPATSEWPDRYLQRWNRFYARRNKQLPATMNEVARRMAFPWPSH